VQRIADDAVTGAGAASDERPQPGAAVGGDDASGGDAAAQDDVAHAGPSVIGDAQRPVQVLVNLLANAIKFAPEHSTLRLGTARVPGLGLGLWIVKSIVERHKGSVRVERTAQQRTRFTVSLPAESS
jgi:signal transduction histidine kinase